MREWSGNLFETSIYIYILFSIPFGDACAFTFKSIFFSVMVNVSGRQMATGSGQVRWKRPEAHCVFRPAASLAMFCL